MEHAFERSGYVILMNPSPDGNCHFNAVTDQLRRLQISSMPASQVRQALVDYMVEFRQSPFNDRDDFADVFDSNRYSSYEEYINMMRQDSTFGDHLTQQAISEYFFVRSYTRSVIRSRRL